MAIFGFKKPKTDKLEQAAGEAKVAKTTAAKTEKPKATKATKTAKTPRATTKAVATREASSSPVASFSSITDVILRPRITEKSGVLGQAGQYTFEVLRTATKPLVMKAIASMYKVHPIAVRVVNMPTRNVFQRGRKGTVAGVRKVIVTLRKGETIEFV